MSIFLVALGLSMDAFTLALSYGINKVSLKKMLITAGLVGIFHFFMPLIGSYIGDILFVYTIIKPKIVLFFVFLILSIDMYMHYFCEDKEIRKLNLIGIIFFAFSVSFDSFSVGLGINYLFDNIELVLLIFCITSFTFTFLGFSLGKVISKKYDKFSFIIGGTILLLYSLWVLTK